MTVSTFRVSDMHCGACVAKVERALAGMAGIGSTRINAARRQVLVEHPPETDPIEILQRIEDAGFHPSLAAMTAAAPDQRDML